MAWSIHIVSGVPSTGTISTFQVGLAGHGVGPGRRRRLVVLLPVRPAVEVGLAELAPPAPGPSSRSAPASTSSPTPSSRRSRSPSCPGRATPSGRSSCSAAAPRWSGQLDAHLGQAHLARAEPALRLVVGGLAAGGVDHLLDERLGLGRPVLGTRRGRQARPDPATASRQDRRPRTSKTSPPTSEAPRAARSFARRPRRPFIRFLPPVSQRGSPRPARPRAPPAPPPASGIPVTVPSDPRRRRVELRVVPGEKRLPRQRHRGIGNDAVPLEGLAPLRDVVGDRVLEPVAVGQLLDDRGERRPRRPGAEDARPTEVLQSGGEDLGRRRGKTVDQDGDLARVRISAAATPRT